MKKRKLNDLKLKKTTISKIAMDNVRGGAIPVLLSFLCASAIHQGEDNCVSIQN